MYLIINTLLIGVRIVYHRVSFRVMVDEDNSFFFSIPYFYELKGTEDRKKKKTVPQLSLVDT